MCVSVAQVLPDGSDNLGADSGTLRLLGVSSSSGVAVKVDKKTLEPENRSNLTVAWPRRLSLAV